MKSKTIRVIFLGIILFFENCTSWPGLFLFLAGGGGGGGNSPLLILPPGGGDSSGSNTTTDGTGSGNTPSLPTLQFASSTSNGSEATASHQVVVSLSGSASETVTVDYTVSGGTATGGGVDYTLANGTLSFASGETSKNIDILLVDDGLPELNETIEITLSNVSSKASLGSTSTHTFTIVDDDSPNVSFASSSSNGNESSTPVTIPVNISISSAQVVTVDYTVSGTATGGGVDYTLANGTLTFPANDNTPQNISLVVANDSLHENDETVIITLSNPSNANLGVTTVYTYTINDNDTAPTVGFDNATGNGAESTATVNIPVSLSAVSGLAATVNYTVGGGTATGGGVDYTLANGTLTFNAGETTKNITLTIADDVIDEGNETVVITLSGPSGSSLGGTTSFTYTINDDDLAPNVAFDSASSSGLESVTTVNLPVSLSSVSGMNVTVDYAVSGGSAVNGTDYTLASGTLTFTAGETTKNISIAVTDDGLFENNETIEVTLSNGGNASVAGNIVHTYTITDNDSAPSVAFNAATSSGSEATTSVTIPVSLSAAAGKDLTVDYSVSGGTAVNGTDYTLANGTLTFTAGTTTQNISITVVNDATTELNETIIISLANATAGLTLGGQTTHTYTINDNDMPTVAFNASTSNGSEATTSVTIPVSLSAAYGQTVTVNYSVTSGTATGSGTDYTLANGTLTFNVGETSKNISVTVVNDALDEDDETIQITLDTPNNATLGGTAVHTYTINDDDAAPTVAFDATSSNGSEATTAVTIPVSLSAVSGKTVTVNYSVTGGNATGSGTDYTLAAGTLTFNPGTTTQNISVTVVNDTIYEDNQTVEVTIDSPSNATLGTNTVHTYTINDDDTAPTVTFSVASQNVNENVGGGTATITINQSAATEKVTSIPFTIGGGSTASGGGTDYSITASPVTINAGGTSTTITVTLNNDAIAEANETVIVDMGTPSNATQGATTTHTVTIVDDDAPSVDFSSASSNANESTTAVSMTVNLSNVSTVSVSVPFSINVASTATGGGTDYTLNTASPLSFAPGETSKTISITVNNDTLDENDETIVVDLGSPTNASLGTTTTHTYTINDDDAAPTVAFNATSSNGSEATTAVILPVSLDASSGKTVTVNYSVSGGSATGSGTDYTLASGTLTFNPGTTTQNISVTVVNDSATELNETIEVTISAPSNATLGGNSVHTYTINDDDMPTVAFNASTSNGSEATTAVTIPVSLSAAYGQTVTVNYSVTSGTATGGGTDYTLANGTLTFNAGVTTQNISVTVVNDTTSELDETIQITLDTPNNATLGGTAVHTYTINDNDLPTVAFNASTSNGSESTAGLTIPVSLSNAFSQTVTVNYSVTSGTATGGGTDYTLANGTLTFNAGETSKNISVTVVNDALDEDDETIQITLDTPNNATLGGTAVHTYTINDDDAAPTVAFDATSSNGSEATTAVTIPVSLSAASGKTVTVNYSVTGGNATGSGTDYTLAAGTLTFNAGETSKNISVTVVNDTRDEDDETIQITLDTPNNAGLGGNSVHTYTINDDDAAPTVAFDATSSNGSEATTAVTIPVSLSAASDKTVTVNYSVTGGNATGSGTDYTLAAGTLTFNAGVTTQNISVTVVNDTLDEDDETIQITLDTPNNSTLGGNTAHTYTINDNDNPPTVAFDTTVSSGDESTTTVNFAVSLSGASSKTITVDYSLNGITATGGGVDFSMSPGTITFNPGVTTQNITATIVNDSLDEADETFSMTIANPNNASLGVNTTHTYTILDNDDSPTVAFNSATDSSADESATTRTVAVSLSAASGRTVTVTVNHTGGTATLGTDYTDPGFPLTLTFTAGVTTQNVSIPILSDLEVEGNETVTMSLSGPSNATLGGITAHSYTITDDDIGIISAETMDSNNDGQIDHYKITFSEAVTDSSFPGYSANAIGSAQTDWLVAGFSGVVLAHGTSAPESDTPDDSVIYLRFTPSGASDTNAKPDLTTTATPQLVTVSSKTVGRVYTASVTELDRAKPVVVGATSNTTTSLLTVTFSEPVWGAGGMPACGSGGDVATNAFTYNNVSGGGASSLAGMGADVCGTDNIVTVSANTNFLMADHNVDTIALTANLFDAANNTGNTTAKTLSITQGPVITSAEIYDTNKNGKIDQIKLTFDISMQDSTIDDADASRFTFNGTALTKVDSVSSGTGTISSPNNDPGVANDAIITVFTDDFSVSGTDAKTLAFTQNAGRWQGNSLDLQTISSVTITDKAPPVILTAVAKENATPLLGVDSDDTLVITFSEATNKPTIDSSNIATILSTTPAHDWGTVTSATWNPAGTELTILFAGTGTTISVGDYVNILGTIADASGNVSVNIPSANPISGNFNVTYPRVSSASSINTTTVRVSFTEPVNNTEAQNTANYKIANSSPAVGACSDNTNFTGSTSVLSISSVAKVDDYTYDLTTAAQGNGTSYVLLVNKSGINHKDYAGYTVECPNNANFIGQEIIRIANVSCNTLTTVVVTFSKNVKTGINLAGSAECNSKAECDKRYTIKGTVSGVEIGDLQSVSVLDGTVCGGLPANASRVCLTHSLLQSGSIYTLVSANNTDGDGFDDTSFGAIRDSADSESLQLSPKDRGSFAGCGTVPHNFVEGPIISDPFGDGTAFGYLNKYGNKVYIGPNKNGNGATRFNADGSFPENLTFELSKDGTGSRVSSSSASAPFSSIGYTGCTTNNAGTLGCGPNNENGRGLFAVGTFSGTEYLFLGGAATSNNDYLYYTQDLDSILNFNYMDANQVFHNYDTGTCPANNSSSVTQNQVTESIHIFNGAIYWSSPGDGTNRPFSVKINALKGEINCNAGDGDYFNMRYMTGVGRRADSSPGQIDSATNTTMQAQPDILGGVFHSFNDRLYFANSGSISYQKNVDPNLRCIEGDSYRAGVCEQTGGMVRSINNNPGKCTRSGGVNTCSDWVNVTPSSSDYRKYFSIGLEDNKDLINGQKPIPAFEEFNGNYYFIRNACTKVLWDDGSSDGGNSNNGCAFSSSCGTTNRNDDLCADSDRVPQLWKCVPGGDGHCDAGDWSLVAQNGTTGKTNFGDSNNLKITMISKNGSYLYVGFDNSTTGIEIWRTNTANPSSEGDFSQIGGDGFGSGTNITEIYSNISLQSGSIYYLYLSIGKNSVPVKVHRQQNN